MEKREPHAGENFIPEYFEWIEPDEQKRRAKELEKMTKENKKTKK